MKHIHQYETFINEDGPIWDKMKSVYQDAKKGIASRFGYGETTEDKIKLTEEQIDFLNDCVSIAYRAFRSGRDFPHGVGEWKVNPDTGLIDVDAFTNNVYNKGVVDCSGKNLNDFKGLGFGVVTGNFNCENNNLKTLDGSPREVYGSFWCGDNPLISLKGAPLKIVGYFIYDNLFIHYNPKAFLREIKRNPSGVSELLLTHHFFTPEAIKQKIREDNTFLKSLLGVWNTLYFEKKTR